MAIALEGFDRVAASVAERMAEMLNADTAVLDDQGFVVGSNEPRMLGIRFSDIGRSSEDVLRMPLRLNNRNAEMVVTHATSGEIISPRIAQVIADLIVNQTEVVDRLPSNAALKNKFIHDLLMGDERQEVDIVREATILGMDFSVPRAVILIDASDFIDAPSLGLQGQALVDRRVDAVIRSIVGFFDLPTDTICGYIGGGEIVVLKASSTRDLFEWTDDEEESPQWITSWANLVALKRAAAALHQRLLTDTQTDMNIAIGRYHPGIKALAKSYTDAQAALRLGPVFKHETRVHCLDGLGLASFVGISDESTKIDLARHLLSPLDSEPELIQSLESFFDHDCSVSLTATLLGIHRNTLAYRLDKIASLTGLDPRRFDEAVQIRVAIALRSLHSPT